MDNIEQGGASSRSAILGSRGWSRLDSWGKRDVYKFAAVGSIPIAAEVETPPASSL